MEEPNIVQLSELFQRSLPLSAAASIRKVPGISDPSCSLNSMSKKRKFYSSESARLSDIDNEVDDSEGIPTSKIIYAHRHPAVLVGTVRLADSSPSNPGCSDNDCLTFSDGTARVCCSVIRLDFKILGRPIRVHAWNFIPLKCSGVLEIICWDLVNPTGEVDFRTSPLLPLDYACSGRGEPAVYGKMVAVSPIVTVSSVIRSRKYRTRAEHGISDKRNLKGFLADIMVCDCASCNSGAFLEKSDHSCTKPVILFFCGSTSSWRPVISSLLGSMVCVRDVKKKLLLTGEEKKYEMFFTKERAALYLCQLPAETISVRQKKISGKGEIGVYKGTVTGIYMQGMLMELDKKVWLLLTNYSPVAPHFLRIGSIISLSNIHFVHTTFPWEKVLLLGSCIKTNLHVNSFSPVEAQCIYRPLKRSSLGKFIESLTFSAKFW